MPYHHLSYLDRKPPKSPEKIMVTVPEVGKRVRAYVKKEASKGDPEYVKLLDAWMFQRGFVRD